MEAVDVRLNESAQVSLDALGASAADREPVVVSTKGKQPARNGAKKSPARKYISPYKMAKTLHKSPPKKQFPQIENPQMAFGRDTYSPTRPSQQMPPMVSIRTPASQRPKGSFMEPTASRMLKQISKQDLMPSQSSVSIPEKKTFSKRRATEA